MIRDLALATPARTLGLGADFGGNATLIDASASVVGLAVGEKHGFHRVAGLPAARRPLVLASVALANGFLLVAFAL